MILYRVVFMIMALMIITGCATVKVKTDFDPEFDFSTLKTYRWATDKELNPDDELVKNPLLRKRFVKSVNQTMVQKGLTKAESGEADFVIVMHAGTKEKVRVDQTSTISGPVLMGRRHYSSWYGPGWGYHSGSTTVSYYTEGTLVIDIVAWKTKEMVWRGAGTKTVRDYSSHEKQQESIDESVTKILEDFPPEQIRIPKESD